MPNSVQRLSQIKLNPTREKSVLRFHLAFQSSERRSQNIEFELVSSDAMALLSALQSVQRKTGWRVPQYFGQRGRPFLKVAPKE